MIEVVTSMNKLLATPCKTLATSVLAMSLSSCGVLSYKMPWSDSNIPDNSLISKNLVDAIAQYPKLNPLMSTVQMSKTDNAFERQVYAEMSQRGYKLETSSIKNAVNSVDALVRPAVTGDSSLYVLSVGQLTAERHYARIDGKTVPTSELVIRGGETRTVTLNDDDVFGTTNALVSNVVFEPGKPAVVSEPPVEPEPPALAAATVNPVEQPLLPMRSPVKQNMYDTMESNYLGVFSEYEDMEQSILVFPNDSLQLGDSNKRIIEQYVEMMDPVTDVLSVIGCSHGKTAISNGNSLLALGRANRVKEAFLFSGVEHDQILEEGCWAPVTFDEVMPRRGVVLTLKRRKS